MQGCVALAGDLLRLGVGQHRCPSVGVPPPALPLLLGRRHWAACLLGRPPGCVRRVLGLWAALPSPSPYPQGDTLPPWGI